MRIAIISTPFIAVPPASYGGTELVVATLVAGLLARGHEVTLYATGDSAIPGADHRALYPKAVWPPAPYHELAHVAFAVQDILGAAPFDVVHAHAPAAIGFARLLDLPMVYTLHHEREETLNALYRAHARNVTMVAIGERQRELVADVCEARVVHHGLPEERYPLGAGGAYAAFLGRFAREKGVHLAIDAARRAGVPIRLAGRPHWKDEAYFDAEVKPRLAKPGVEWLGEATHAPKVALLSGAIASLVPLCWEEPFGLVMVESMLCGTPVIAFGRGSAAEVVDEGVTGWVVRDLDEMAARLLGLARGERFDRVRCRERAIRRFGAARMTDDYTAVYADAAGRAEAPARALAP